MERLLPLILTAAVGLVPGELSAQSIERAEPLSMSSAAAVSSQPEPVGSDRWADDRNSDSDSDEDSDRRRGGMFDHPERDGRGPWTTAQ